MDSPIGFTLVLLYRCLSTQWQCCGRQGLWLTHPIGVALMRRVEVLAHAFAASSRAFVTEAAGSGLSILAVVQATRRTCWRTRPTRSDS
jgi:hypothetical protein